MTLWAACSGLRKWYSRCGITPEAQWRSDVWLILAPLFVFACIAYLVKQMGKHDKFKCPAARWPVPWQHAIGVPGGECDEFLSQLLHLARSGDYHGLQEARDVAKFLGDEAPFQLKTADPADEALGKGLTQGVRCLSYLWLAAVLSEGQTSLSQLPRPLAANAPFRLLHETEPSEHPQVVSASCRALTYQAAGLGRRQRPGYCYGFEESQPSRMHQCLQRWCVSDHPATRRGNVPVLPMSWNDHALPYFSKQFVERVFSEIRDCTSLSAWWLRSCWMGYRSGSPASGDGGAPPPVTDGGALCIWTSVVTVGFVCHGGYELARLASADAVAGRELARADR
jgi:hypothetical protein